MAFVQERLSTYYIVNTVFDAVYLIAAIVCVPFVISRHRRHGVKDTPWLVLLLGALFAFSLAQIFSLANDAMDLRAYTSSYRSQAGQATPIVLSVLANFWATLRDFFLAALFLMALTARRAGALRLLGILAFIILVALGITYFGLFIWANVLQYLLETSYYSISDSSSTSYSSYSYSRRKAANAALTDTALFTTYISWSLLYTTFILIAAVIAAKSRGAKSVTIACFAIIILFMDLSWILELVYNAFFLSVSVIGFYEHQLEINTAFDVIETLAYVVTFYVLGFMGTQKESQYDQSTFLGHETQYGQSGFMDQRDK